MQLIHAMNEVFDVAVITSELNRALFEQNLHVKQTIILKDKALLTPTLATETASGDIILFANDAPNFI